MNGLVIKGENNFKERIKFFFLKTKKEMIKNVWVYEIPYFDEKKIIKIIKRDNIKKVAFDREFKNSDRFDVVDYNDVIRKNIDKIIGKLSKTIGIKKGNLAIGTDNPEILLRLFKEKERIKYIYVYNEMRDICVPSCDDFYIKTGVPAVCKENQGDEKINVYIKTGDKYDIVADYIIDLSNNKLNTNNSINNIIIKIPDELKKYNIDSVILGEIFEIDFKIKGFLMGK